MRRRDWASRKGARAAVIVMAAAVPAVAQAQEISQLLNRNLPFPDYRSLQPGHYGMRIGPVRLRYDVSLSAVYTDNQNLATSGNEEEDFGLRPSLTVGVFYPISEQQALQVDVGFGYQWWENNSDLNRFYLAPNSHFDYLLRIGEVRLLVYDNLSTSSEASSRAEIAGGAGGTDFAFHRIYNAAGLNAQWGGSRRLILGGGYSYAISRSLTDDYTDLDRNTHALNGSAMVRITAPLAAGVGASFSDFAYLEGVQNDGQTVSIGPVAEWRPRRSLSLNAGFYYTKSDYSTSGTIADRSDFSGMTFNVGADYEMNRSMRHMLMFYNSIDPGYGSNFTESRGVSYGFRWAVNDRLGSSLGFEYANSDISGSLGENVDLFRINVGAGYQVYRRLNLGLTYQWSDRSSDQPDRDYVENRATLTASYQF